jgi:hypothetical protein
VCSVTELKGPENLNLSVSVSAKRGGGGTHDTVCPALNADCGDVVEQMVITNG